MTSLEDFRIELLARVETLEKNYKILGRKIESLDSARHAMTLCDDELKRSLENVDVSIREAEEAMRNKDKIEFLNENRAYHGVLWAELKRRGLK